MYENERQRSRKPATVRCSAGSMGSMGGVVGWLCGNRLSVCSRIKFNEPQLIVHDNTIKTFTKNYILFSLFNCSLFFACHPVPLSLSLSLENCCSNCRQPLFGMPGSLSCSNWASESRGKDANVLTSPRKYVENCQTFSLVWRRWIAVFLETARWLGLNTLYGLIGHYLVAQFAPITKFI